ncbi:hypothetical protein BS78_03G297500 [Paspalum vaginatum]|nr:hypothetical protein BS78_03G297500 [Paspalum vaginatum]
MMKQMIPKFELSIEKGAERRTQMQVLSRSFLRLLRGSSPSAATAPAPAHRRLSCHLLFLSASPPLSRRVSPPLSSPVRHASLTTLEAVDGKRDAPEETSGSDSDVDSEGPCDWGINGVVPLLYRLPKSRHRDGSLYRRADRGWKKDYCIADRSETQLEAMKLSNSPYCRLHADGTCYWHPPDTMLQIFSLKLAKIHVHGGSVELYGYIAMRDRLNPLLNHVINFSRDDPVVVDQGSVINMTGPKRGIELVDSILIEYDMRIKTGKQEKDDLQLIDGVSVIDDWFTVGREVFKGRIRGECGVIDITASRIYGAVEATIEVFISELCSSFSLFIGCFTSGLHEEIQLFGGIIGESRGLKRSVVAVRMGTSVDLKFKLRLLQTV